MTQHNFMKSWKFAAFALVGIATSQSQGAMHDWNVGTTPAGTYSWFDGTNWVGSVGGVPVNGNTVDLEIDNVQRTYDINNGGAGVFLPNSTIDIGRGVYTDGSGNDDVFTGNLIRMNGAGGQAAVFNVPVVANSLTTDRHGATFNAPTTIGTIDSFGGHQINWTFNASPTAPITSIRMGGTDDRGGLHDDNFTVNVDMETLAFDLEWGRITVGAGATFDVGAFQMSDDAAWLVKNQLVLHGNMFANSFDLEMLNGNTILSLTDQGVGTWGAIGNLDVDHQVAFITGNGILTVGQISGGAIPEPAGLALLGLAAGALARRRRRLA